MRNILLVMVCSLAAAGGISKAFAQTYQPGTSREFSYETEFGRERPRNFLNSQNRLIDEDRGQLERRGNWDTDLSWERRSREPRRPVDVKPFSTRP